MPNALIHLHLLALTIAELAGRSRTVHPGLPDRTSCVRRSSRRWADDRGQATTEYALVLLAGALVALLVIAWATAGGGAAKVAQLFDRVIDSVLSNV